MANTVRTIARPQVPVAGAEASATEPADYLVVEIVNAVGTPTAVVIREADHAGVLAEYETGTATTLLEAAIDADFSGILVDDSSPTQEGWKDTYTPAEPV